MLTPEMRSLCRGNGEAHATEFEEFSRRGNGTLVLTHTTKSGLQVGSEDLKRWAQNAVHLKKQAEKNNRLFEAVKVFA